jgi:hypothetical protein
MTSKTTTKAGSPRTSSPRIRRRKSQKKSNRINRQRRLQKQLQALLLERHSRRCIICHHPEREAIEEEFVHWRSPSRLAHDYKLADYRTVYRHARPADLLLQRRERLHSALDAFVESVDDVTFTGDTILRAMRAYSCIDSHGRWTEIPTQVQFSTSNDGPPPQSSPRGTHVGSDVIDIDADDESEEDPEGDAEENADNASEERVTALDVLNVIRKYSNQAPRSDAIAPEDECDELEDDHSDAEEDAENALEEFVTSLSTDPNGEDDSDDDPDDNNDPKNKSEADRLEKTTACAVPPAQPAAPQRPKPDADGLIWHPHSGYPNQEMSEPDAQGRVRYKIHMTTAASQLPSRETDAQRAAKLIYGSVIKKYGNP